MAAIEIRTSKDDASLPGLDGAAEKRLVDLFEGTVLPESASHGGAWLHDLRRDAMDKFVRMGLPHRRIEAWKYTDIRPRLKKPLSLPATAPDTIPAHVWIEATEGRTHRLVFVDGLLKPRLSDVLPADVELVVLTDVAAEPPRWLRYHFNRTVPLEGRPLLALNTAMMRSGVFLRVNAGARIETPVEFVFHGANGGVQAHVRNLLVLEEGASATLIESYVGSTGEPYFVNSAVEIVGGPGSRLAHVKVQSEGPEALHISTLAVRLDRGAGYDGFYLTQGAALARHDGTYVLGGPDAALKIGGATMLSGRQHADVTTVVEHKMPKGVSRQEFHGALDGRAKGVYQGRIHVHPGAQGTDGYQLSKALLLSDKAEMDTKPELEIYADDVKCSHGATVGALDEAALFYLRSRGLPLTQARSVLTEAFLDDVIDKIEDETWRVPLRACVARWLDRNATSQGVQA